MRRWGGWAAAAAALAYSGNLILREFFHDDQLLIAGNSLLRLGWRGLWGLWTTGYWEAVQGSMSTAHYYRPVPMTTFWFQAAMTGLWAPAMHAVNVGLHVLVVLLLHRVLSRRLEPRVADAAAVFYAVSPMHTEAVTALAGRSEMLGAAFILSAWLCLEGSSTGRRRWVGLLLFFLGLLSKETVFLFPLLLAMSDWVFHGDKPWLPRRRGLYAVLAVLSLLVLVLRFMILPEVVAGGLPYFDSRLTASLTLSRFAWIHYLWPSLTGLGQCSDYSKPLIADAGLSSFSGWLSFGTIVALTGWGLWAVLRRRSPAGFWICFSALFMLPFCHLLVPLDTLAAERYLYLPMIGLAVAAGAIYDRLRRRWPLSARSIGLGLAVWFMAMTFLRNRTYRSRESFYRAAVSCNPVSARAWSSLGAALLLKGERETGVSYLQRACALDPALGSPHYNLGRLAFSEGRWPEAEQSVETAIGLSPKDADAFILSALLAERRGDLSRMRRHLERALSIFPGHALAEFNLGRYWLLAGRKDLAAARFRRYLLLSPGDPEVSSLLRRLEGLP